MDTMNGTWDLGQSKREQHSYLPLLEQHSLKQLAANSYGVYDNDEAKRIKLERICSVVYIIMY
ncbi:hypothetical protein CUMW_179010 [Citrus unshiu]|nr:hypothetical protein CUMW_179010 [Citrus unshiu]